MGNAGYGNRNFFFKNKSLPLKKTFFLFDTVGIRSFTLLGIQKSLLVHLEPVVALIMGMISVVFVLRDVLTNKVPLLLKKNSICLLLW